MARLIFAVDFCAPVVVDVSGVSDNWYNYAGMVPPSGGNRLQTSGGINGVVICYLSR